MRLDEIRCKAGDGITAFNEPIIISPNQMCPTPSSIQPMSPSYQNFFNFNSIMTLTNPEILRNVLVSNSRLSQ